MDGAASEPKPGREGKAAAQPLSTASSSSASPSTGADFVPRWLVRNSRPLGATIGIVTILASSGTAYALGHIGRGVKPEFSTRGCRHHLIQDISCGALFLPEYPIFAIGCPCASLCFAVVFRESAWAIEDHMGAQTGRIYRVAGLGGCVFFALMAIVSMRIHKLLHLLLACIAFCLWIAAFSIRAASGLRPHATLARLTVVGAGLGFSIWGTGILFKKSLSLAEWIAALSMLVHVFTLPVPASRRSVRFVEQDEVELRGMSATTQRSAV